MGYFSVCGIFYLFGFFWPTYALGKSTLFGSGMVKL
jgi:hypothetical protein